MEPSSKRQRIFAFIRLEIVLLSLITSSFLILESFFDGPSTIFRKVTAIITFILSVVLLFIESTIDIIDMSSFFED